MHYIMYLLHTRVGKNDHYFSVFILSKYLLV